MRLGSRQQNIVRPLSGTPARQGSLRTHDREANTREKGRGWGDSVGLERHTECTGLPPWGGTKKLFGLEASEQGVGIWVDIGKTNILVTSQGWRGRRASRRKRILKDQIDCLRTMQFLGAGTALEQVSVSKITSST